MTEYWLLYMLYFTQIGRCDMSVTCMGSIVTLSHLGHISHISRFQPSIVVSDMPIQLRSVHPSTKVGPQQLWQPGSACPTG
jgi:hypothetical protein